jgi:hypothetical protein
MALFSAADDFSRRTLAALPGLLAKLQYVSGLRRDDGQYAHWGLARVYGEHAARQAIEGIHKDLTLQVLRTPLRELVEDAIQSAENAETDVAEYVAQLNAESGRLLPDKLAGGSVRHFSTVLQALSSLSRSCTVANRRVS